MTDRELMQQALDALEKLNKDGWILADFEDEVYASIEALRVRLAQPEQEPVAWHYAGSDVEPNSVALDADLDAAQKANCIPLYAVPPQREWQGLTDEDRQEVERWIEFKEAGGNEPVPAQKIITYVETKLKEKNT